ncbi:hypothetical protein HU200_053189 [Digitaria exilis]|uniref:Uncharacterized protein n=1 Tax=Digitaria exilis TaxID=1010633 RepID=A0A835AHM6_9POAL|nr:hypothetical protein HU200_053189 [Digitaria exilis]CAB3459816.1 unnamed protein product [Digitaria exilis]
MERKGKMEEIAVARADVVPVSGSVAIREVKQEGKEPTTPGTPSPATVWRDSDGRRGEGGAVGTLPGWKLDCLCSESSLPPAAKGG